MAGQRLGWLAILVLCGCGGGTAAGGGPETGGLAEGEQSPAESEATDTGDPAAATTEEGASGEGSSSSDDTGGSAESVVGTLEGEELESVLQSVLSDPELVDNLHVNKPGRAPLKVAGPNLPAKMKVVVGSHDIKVVDEPTSKKDAVLVFTKIERTGDQVRLRYRFDVEGITGSATVFRKNGRWTLAANRVIEK